MDLTQFQDPALCKNLVARLQREMTLYGKPVRFMEVCGTHTVSIFQSGLRALLPPGMTHISGPGCPVCVTHDSEVAAFVELAQRPNVIIATFGDLLRVPDPQGRSLKHAQAEGARIQVVYSPLDAVALAAAHPHDMVVFLGVGFETTAPTVAGAILAAQQQKLTNFTVLCCHKLTPPALRALLDNDEGHFNCDIDAFLLPGHVSIILGVQPFSFIANIYKRPAAIAGFEAADILSALCLMVEQLRTNKATIINAYPRAVAPEGNPTARRILDQVFRTRDARWRGLGVIPRSGLAINDAFAPFDAADRLDISFPNTTPLPGCKCGEILTGSLQPPDCPLFAKACTPQNPTGPCMVSTEGSCSAWYRYGDH